ncbi:MAG: SMR family transporter [Pseudomonadales bacterium]|nr:SMR family transporter [Pseudomonadales bacterium]
MSWFILFNAGILESGWLVGIQKSDSLTKIPYLAFAVSSMLLSLVLFSIAAKDIPISHAYLVWLPMAASSISIINHCFFHQPLSTQQLLCFWLFFVAVAGLKMSKQNHKGNI